jgi:ABC-type cobalamin transport system ATPase subunit
MDSMIDQLVPLFRRAGVAVVFSGHEHNFQLSRWDGITYLVSGAGGMLREEAPTQFAEAHTEAWAAEEHFLLVEINGRRMEITPIAGLEQGNDLQPLELLAPGGETVPTPIVVDRG